MRRRCKLLDFLGNMLNGFGDAFTPGFGMSTGPGWRSGIALGVGAYMLAPARFGSFFGPPGTVVIGAMEDLGASRGVRSGERTLLQQLTPNLGSVEANWARNARVLLREMQSGRPIRDASVDAAGKLNQFPETRFIARERALLRQHGWVYCEGTRMWAPGMWT